MMIPEHFKQAFPWVSERKSNIHAYSQSTKWHEKEIISLIFRDSDEMLNDPRLPLFKALSSMDKNLQVKYIKSVAKCLAEAVMATPLPNWKEELLGDVKKDAKRLSSLLRKKPKERLPLNWGDCIFLIMEVIKRSNASGNSELTDLSNVLKDVQRKLVLLNLNAKVNVKIDLASILSLVSEQSKELAGQPAIEYYRYPQEFFNQIITDKTLYLAYQRKGIIAITSINHDYFSKPYDALTAHVLTCVLPKKISNQSVKKIRESHVKGY